MERVANICIPINTPPTPINLDTVIPPKLEKDTMKLSKYGFRPIFVTPSMPEEQVAYLFSVSDGVLLTGGPDVHPASYGHTVHPETERIDLLLDNLQRTVIGRARQDKKPVLGECRGAQMLSVAVGGTLIQHLPDITEEKHGKSITVEGAPSYHDVLIKPGTKAFEIFQTNHLTNVLSRHHQAIDDPGELIVSGVSPEGIVEVVEDPNLPFFIGVQTHPELVDSLDTLYSAFADAVLVYQHDRRELSAA